MFSLNSLFLLASLSIITLSQLISLGSHIGELASSLHPRSTAIAPFGRNGLAVLDQIRSLSSLRRALVAAISTFQNNGSAVFIGFDPSLWSTLDALRRWTRQLISSNLQLYNFAVSTYLSQRADGFDDLYSRNPLDFPSRTFGWSPPRSALDQSVGPSSPLASLFDSRLMRFLEDRLRLDRKEPSDFIGGMEILSLAKFGRDPSTLLDRLSSGSGRDFPPKLSPGSLVRHYYLSRIKIYGTLTNLEGSLSGRTSTPEYRHFHALPQFAFLFDVARANASFIRELIQIRVPFLTPLDSDMDGGLSNLPFPSNNDRSSSARFWHGFFTRITGSLFQLDLCSLYLPYVRSRLGYGHRSLDIFRYESDRDSFLYDSLSVPDPALPRLRLKRYLSSILGSSPALIPKAPAGTSRLALLFSRTSGRYFSLVRFDRPPRRTIIRRPARFRRLLDDRMLSHTAELSNPIKASVVPFLAQFNSPGPFGIPLFALYAIGAFRFWQTDFRPFVRPGEDPKSMAAQYAYTYAQHSVISPDKPRTFLSLIPSITPLRFRKLPVRKFPPRSPPRKK